MVLKKEKIELYSFDIFDTIVTRHVAVPKGISAIMQEKLIKNLDFLIDFSANFYAIRVEAEKYIRDYYKNKFGYDDITFDEIYKHIQEKHSLSDNQIKCLQDTEFDLELENIIGIEENILKIKKLLNEGKRVILVSDMYYSPEQLHIILSKVDNVFDNIKIYVSSQYRKSKFYGNLYKIIKEEENIEYKNWKHIGDNEYSDIKRAKELGINAEKYGGTGLMPYEKDLVNSHPEEVSIQKMLGVSKLLRLNKQEKNQDKYNFGASFSGPILYNYVSEVIDTALDRGYKTLYFIARDGYIPKLIADIIIKAKNLPLKTKYIYGSRLAWRIPDKGNYEYFIEITFKEFQKKLSLEFLSYRIGLSVDRLSEYLNIKSKTKIFSEKIREAVKAEFLNNPELKDEIIKSFDEKRELFIQYLQQEINFDEKDIAFVEVNGSGKTQVILCNYLNKIADCNICTFYLTVSSGISDYNLQTYVYCTKQKAYSIILELLCRTNYGQTVGYNKEGSEILPVFEDFNEDSIVKWGYFEHIRGIIDFADCMASNFSKLCNKELFYTYFDYVSKRCDRQTAEILGDVPFLLVGSEGKMVKAAPELTLCQFLQLCLLKKDITEFSQCPDLSYVRGNKIINFIKDMINKFDFILDFFIELKLFLLIKKLRKRKIAFWGASIFLENFINRRNISSENIVAIIDKNPLRQGQTIGNYIISPPDKLYECKPDYLIMTIKNRHKDIYKNVAKTMENDFKDIQLLPDIFIK